MKKTLYLILLCFIQQTSYAQNCSVNFNYGIVIDPKNIRMLDQGMTYIQINQDQQLFVRGREITLSTAQQKQLEHYSIGIREQIPEIVSIAIEGVDIALKAVNKVISGLTGENSATHQKIQEKFEEIKWRIRARFNHSNQNYYLASQDLDDFDDLLSGEFEQEIEEIITESVGTILMAVGESILNSNKNDTLSNSEERVTTFDQKMKHIGKNLKIDVDSSITALESKAEQFCLSLVELNKVEAQLQQTIPELKNYNLIETQQY